ncbi:DUF4401 domain-containing protein [Desulfovibrio intestinalis]|uniref:Putative membrane protein n=1 Tax=Desulfovibrio intestinalis TaxID=58621 RepID=A0A7W8C2G0_9BACT|nr:DUF4401 domain-containing protein [Desulfovibrio intestinalis]MBB5142964.1 putative membrane protein [Desulfovibrio intestinalis]
MNEVSASAHSDTDIPVVERASATEELLPPLTRSSLSFLCDSGGISPTAWSKALDFCGFRPDGSAWLAYWRQVSILGGVLFFLAGLICFIAWNWGDMRPFQRMGLVGLVVAGGGIGAVIRGLDTRLGQALLLTCGVAMGPMLAVFGQTYQTGAELWELFRVWTVLLVLLAIAGKQAGLWFASWLSGNVFVALWLGRSLSSPFDAFSQFFVLPEWLLVIACAVALWEWAARRAGQKESRAWLRSRWLPRLLFFDLIVRTTSYLIITIFDAYYVADGLVLWLPHQFVVLFAVIIACLSCWWYRKKEPDLFMLASLLGAGTVILIAVLAKSELFFDAGVVTAFLLWGLLIAGITAGLAKILLHLQRSMAVEQKSEAATGFSNSSGFTVFGRARPDVSWQALWKNLQAHGAVQAEDSLPRLEEPISPWYIRLLLSLGGWLTALLFVCFLGFLLFATLGIDSYEWLSILVVSVPILFVGRMLVAGNQIFSRHFGFALSITGSVGIAISLFLTFDKPMLACFALAVLLVGISIFMRAAAYTFLAAASICGCVAIGISFLLYEGLGDGLSAHLVSIAVNLSTLWWILVGLGLAYFCMREGKWRGSSRGPIADAWFFGAYAGMLLFQIAALGLPYGLNHFLSIPVIGAAGIGLGAAVGTACVAFFLTRKRSWQVRAAVMIGMVIFIVLSRYQPGATLAVFGLVLARQLGNAVMQGFVLAYLLAYMIFYYYNLAVPFSMKSAYLTITGVLLLLLALILQIWKTKMSKQEASHA